MMPRLHIAGSEPWLLIGVRETRLALLVPGTGVKNWTPESDRPDQVVNYLNST